MFWQRNVKGWKNSFSLITQSVVIVSIENFFVLALIRSFEKVQEIEARPKDWLVSICFDNKI